MNINFNSSLITSSLHIQVDAVNLYPEEKEGNAVWDLASPEELLVLDKLCYGGTLYFGYFLLASGDLAVYHKKKKASTPKQLREDYQFLHEEDKFKTQHNPAKRMTDFAKKENKQITFFSADYFASCFQYDPQNHSYAQLERWIITAINICAKVNKFFLLSIGRHSFGLYYHNETFYSYDLDNGIQKRVRAFSIDLFQVFTKHIVNLTNGKAISAGIEVITTENISEEFRSGMESISNSILRGDPKGESFNGRTPFMIATASGKFDFAKKLLQLKEGDSVDATDPNGRTPLLDAAHNGQEGTVDFLIDLKANAAIAEKKHGFSPLHAASEQGHENIVKKLLNYNKDTANIKTPKGETPKKIASQHFHFNIVSLLFDATDD